MNVKSLLVSVSLALACSAHTIFQQVWVNGVDQGFENGLRLPSYDGPITDVTSAPMSCNGGPNPLLYNSTNIITVPAGATVQGRWGQYLEVGSPSVDPSHKGPIMVYLAPVSNAVTSAPPVNGWFKIYQDGLHSDGTTWAVDTMIANNGLWSFTIPSCIKPGQYLMRGELIALHAASTYPGAQLYMECAQIQITGSGTTVPSNTVSFPGAYKSTDPGITFNLYAGAKTYTIPGPAPFTCSGSGGSSPPASTAPVTTAPATTAPATTSKPPTSTTSAPSAAQTAYGQCGGQGWAGATTCVSGFTCKVSSTYYSQCLPS